MPFPDNQEACTNVIRIPVGQENADLNCVNLARNGYKVLFIDKKGINAYTKFTFSLSSSVYLIVACEFKNIYMCFNHDKSLLHNIPITQKEENYNIPECLHQAQDDQQVDTISQHMNSWPPASLTPLRHH
jgi:hypothetical protein